METEEEQIITEEKEPKQKQSKQERLQASIESVDFTHIDSPEQILNLL